MKDIREGDIYAVIIENKKIRFFQYIGNDQTQLSSNVIRVFKEEYVDEINVSYERVAIGEIDFHVHTTLKIGNKLKIWKKVGHAAINNSIEYIFRDSSDYGDSKIKKSNNWWIWKINEKQKFVGPLVKKYFNTEIGIVVNPNAVKHRIEKGFYNFFYPDY